MDLKCSRCGVYKPIADFASYPSKPRDSYCRPCRLAHGREHYQRNRERHKRNVRARKRREREKRLAWLIRYLQEHPCCDCGERDPVVLEFDHQFDKLFTMSKGFFDRPWDVVLNEIEKCKVLCANCHRRKTAREQGSHRYLIVQERGRKR